MRSPNYSSVTKHYFVYPMSANRQLILCFVRLDVVLCIRSKRMFFLKEIMLLCQRNCHRKRIWNIHELF